jgi:hypothetical protein
MEGWAWIDKEQLDQYVGFTDIEFNPNRSINCQARSCALFLTLVRRNLLEDVIASPTSFIQVITKYRYEPSFREHAVSVGPPESASATLLFGERSRL